MDPGWSLHPQPSSTDYSRSRNPFHTPSSQSAVTAPQTRLALPTVPAACLACICQSRRHWHLKCDGQRPCSRCGSANLDCVYVASRRGYKSTQRRIAAQNAKRASAHHSSLAATIATNPANNPLAYSAAFNTPVFSGIGPAPPPFSSQTAAFSGLPKFDFQTSFNDGVYSLDIPLESSIPRVLSHQDRYIDSFYHHVFAAHPFVLPKTFLFLIDKDVSFQTLFAAMRWLGSLFTEPGGSDALLKEALLLVDDSIAKNGFLVQSILLLIIGLDGKRQRKKVKKLMTRAQDISIAIGLNTRLFASLNGQGIPVLEESWRRTWWELFIVDALIAGVHQTSKFILHDVPTDVGFPCEEYQYLLGYIPQSVDPDDKDNAGLFDNGREFSSFVYRIQCGYILGTFQKAPSNLAHVECLLANWRLRIPLSKQDAHYGDGQFDEMMFQAHMMMHAISILLHQPHSQLDPSPTHYIKACAPNTPALSPHAFNQNTKHTIRAANELSKLIKYRVPLLTHTHFFAYMVTLSSTIHLATWALAFISHDDDGLRQRLRLNIAALIKYSEIWPAAQHLGAQVKGIAKQVYWMKKQQTEPVEQVGSVPPEGNSTSGSTTPGTTHATLPSHPK
ncbi:hypothetical protein FDECE_13725 [Fusarium decemcellulare]|nr:hypothetical protein FDECE_13725 [Fusarium decemcellulare]